MTRELVLLVGIPASGKSTWCKQYEYDSNVAIISRDDIRKSMLLPGDSYFAREKEVFNEFVRQINDAMKFGIEIVIVDATHISPISRKKILSKLVTDSRTSLIVRVFNVDKEEALRRNRNRVGFAQVPDSAIEKMANGFVIPNPNEFEYCEHKFRRIEVIV